MWDGVIPLDAPIRCWGTPRDRIGSRAGSPIAYQRGDFSSLPKTHCSPLSDQGFSSRRSSAK